MVSKISLVIALFLLLACPSLKARAQVVLYSNGIGSPSNLNNAYLSDYDNSSGPDQWFLADDFSIPNGSSWTGVTWTGAYGIGNTPPDNDDFEIAIYNDNGAGAPENVPFLSLDLNVTRVDTGVDVFGNDVYAYVAEFPAIQWNDPSTIWISIRNRTFGLDDDWFWAVDEVSLTGNAFALINGPPWISSSVIMDFQLLGDFAPPPANFQIVATTGFPSPDGNGYISSFYSPLINARGPGINNQGQVVYYGLLSDTDGGSNDDTAIFRGDGNIQDLIVREGEASPDGEGNCPDLRQNLFYRSYGINGLGQVAFGGFQFLTNTIFDDAVFIGDGSSLDLIIREAEPPGINLVNGEGLNDVGQVLTTLRHDFADGGQWDNEGFYIVDGTSQAEIVAFGLPAPDGNGTFGSDASPLTDFLGQPDVNNLGEVAFSGQLDGTSGGTTDDSGIFRGDGTALIWIVREGDPPPDGVGTFDDFGRDIGFNYVDINDGGEVAFFGRINGGTTAVGYFRSDGNIVTEIVREGQTSPDGDGTISAFVPLGFTINNAGQVIFEAILTGTKNPAHDKGWFRGDGITLTQIVRAGGPAPDGNGNFTDVSNLAMNSLGQAAFVAFILDDVFSPGLFFFDDNSGLSTVIRHGDSFLGSTITNLRLRPSGNSVIGSGLNDIGQIAFYFELADGRNGISIWSPGPPTAVIGDANGDGMFNNLDIASFVLALTNLPAYQAMYPDVDPDAVLDMNGDGVFNNLDIAAFVAALTGGGTK